MSGGWTMTSFDYLCLMVYVVRACFFQVLILSFELITKTWTRTCQNC